MVSSSDSFANLETTNSQYESRIPPILQRNFLNFQLLKHFFLILGPTMAVTQDQIQELLANHEAEKEPVQRTRSSMPDPGRKFSRKFSKYIPR